MSESSIGRVLVASLHQSIADLLPTRLAFYENWLNPVGLREGTIGLAPLYAVLSFLRQEGDVYDMITTRAGQYAAEWTVESMPPFRRAALKAAPIWLRSRMLLRLAQELVRNCYTGSRAIFRVRGGRMSMDLRASIFCTVREPATQPLCGFYAAALTRLLTLFDLNVRAEVVSCRGTGKPQCLMSIAVNGGTSDTGASL